VSLRGAQRQGTLGDLIRIVGVQVEVAAAVAGEYGLGSQVRVAVGRQQRDELGPLAAP